MNAFGNSNDTTMEILGFEVGDARDAMVEELEKAGFVMRTIGYYPGSSWTVVDSEDALGVNINIKPRR